MYPDVITLQSELVPLRRDIDLCNAVAMANKAIVNSALEVDTTSTTSAYTDLAPTSNTMSQEEVESPKAHKGAAKEKVSCTPC